MALSGRQRLHDRANQSQGGRAIPLPNHEMKNLRIELVACINKVHRNREETLVELDIPHAGISFTVPIKPEMYQSACANMEGRNIPFVIEAPPFTKKEMRATLKKRERELAAKEKEVSRLEDEIIKLEDTIEELG